MAAEDQNNTSQTTQAPMPASSQTPVVPNRDEMINKVLQQISKQVSQPRETLQKPNINPKAQHMSGTQVGMVGAASMFMPFLGGAIAKSIKNQKEAQINEAVNEFTSLNNALERAYDMAGGDKQKAEELWKQMPEFQAMFDPNNPAAKKRLKNFAKVFSVDWMNPDKTQNTPHFKGLQKFMQLNQASKLMSHMKGQMEQSQQQPPQQGQPQPQQGQPQQGQGQPQQQGMGDKFVQNYPRQLVQPDLGKAEGFLRALTGVNREERLEKKEELVKSDQGLFTKDIDGKLTPLMYNGKQLKSDKNISGKPGAPVFSNQVPYGILSDDGHTVLTPKSKEWTSKQQELLDAALAAYKTGEKNKDDRAKFIANSRFTAYLQTRYYDAFDRDTNTLVKVNPAMMQSDPGRYGPSGLAAQMSARESMFQEIDYTSSMLKQSLEKLPDYMFSDASFRARMSYILQQSDKPMDAFLTFMQSSTARSLPQPGTPDGDAIMDYLTALASMAESANAARTLGGLGQGSDYVRRSIAKMLPSGSTPTKAYAQKQMTLFDGEMTQLKKSILKVGMTKEERDAQKKGGGGQVYKKGQVPD